MIHERIEVSKSFVWIFCASEMVQDDLTNPKVITSSLEKKKHEEYIFKHPIYRSTNKHNIHAHDIEKNKCY